MSLRWILCIKLLSMYLILFVLLGIYACLLHLWYIIFLNIVVEPSLFSPSAFVTNVFVRLTVMSASFRLTAMAI